MIFQQLLECYREVMTLTKEEQDYIRKALKFKSLKKKKILLYKGEITENFYFILSGCIRSYVEDYKEKEQVISFYTKNWWFTANECVLNKEPSILTMDAVVDTEILILSKQNRDDLIEKYPKFEKYYSINLERTVLMFRQCLINNLILSAEDRYHYFCKHYKELVNTIPQKYIASFIGVTPEFFSSMKNKLNNL